MTRAVFFELDGTLTDPKVGITYGYDTQQELVEAGAGQIVATPTALARLLRTICP